MISLTFGANSYLENIKFSNIHNQNNLTSFNIPSTLRLVGLMVDFQIENPNNPKTSGSGKFLDQDVIH